MNKINYDTGTFGFIQKFSCIVSDKIKDHNMTAKNSF